MSKRMKLGPNPIADVVVPEKWLEFAFEYKHGWSWATVEWANNPVSARGQIVGTHAQARDAWFGGRKDGKRARDGKTA